MISVIAKRIDNGQSPNGGQSAYAHDLLHYMTNPEKDDQGMDQAAGAEAPFQERREKCVAVYAHGFSSPLPDGEQMAAEMAGDCALSMRLKDGQGIDHWVISWKDGENGERPSVDSMMEGAKSWIESMGYGGGRHKYAIAIHADTDHFHAHIALCRVDQLTGKVKPRKWWKRDNQKALAIIAHEQGWQLAPGSRFYCPANAKPQAVHETDEITGQIKTRYEPQVIETEPEEPGKFQPGDMDGRLEARQQIKSYRRLLHERLAAVHEKIKDDLPRMKWGQLHKALAEAGIQMDRREHVRKDGSTAYGLVFSLDGENWQAASVTYKPFTWKELDGHIGAKPGSWRKANADALDILAGVRARQQEEPEHGEEPPVDVSQELEKSRAGQTLIVPTEKAEREIMKTYSKEEIQGIVGIPVDEAREALKAAGVDLNPANARKKIRTSVDVAMQEGGLSYPEALDKLAALFPDAVATGRETGIGTCQDAVDEARRQAQADGDSFNEYKPGQFGYEFRQNLVKWWRALQLEKIDIHTNISDAAYEKARAEGKAIWPLNVRDASLYDVIRETSQIMALSASGQTEEAPISVFCTPKWREGKIGIMIDDLGKPAFSKGMDAALEMGRSFFEKYPPSAKVATSDRLPQGFWIVDRKYPEQEFYDDFIHHLNAVYGDSKIIKQGHDTRIPGLYNRKKFAQDGSGRTPKAHLLESSTRRPVEMEAMIDAYRPIWERREKEKAALVRQQAQADRRPLRPESPDYQAAGESAAVIRAREGLRLVDIPKFIFETGQRCLRYFSAKFQRGVKAGEYAYFDRSRVDSETARVLYCAGASMDEVYSYMADHACQNEDIVSRPYGANQDGAFHDTQRVAGYDDKLRRAAMCATSQAPIGWIEGNWRERNPDKEKDIQQLYGHLIARDEEYRQRMAQIASRNRTPESRNAQAQTAGQQVQARRPRQ